MIGRDHNVVRVEPLVCVTAGAARRIGRERTAVGILACRIGLPNLDVNDGRTSDFERFLVRASVDVLDSQRVIPGAQIGNE